MKGKTLLNFDPSYIVSQILANQLLFYTYLSMVYLLATWFLGWEPHCRKAVENSIDSLHPSDLHEQFLNHTTIFDPILQSSLTEHQDSFWENHPTLATNTTLRSKENAGLIDFLWNDHCLHLDNLNGFIYIILYFCVIALMGRAFTRIVKRTRACLDFSATLFLIHGLFTLTYMGSLPRDLIWWTMLTVFITLLTLYSEILCSWSELEPISLTAAYAGTGKGFIEELNEFRFKGIHLNLPWSSKFSFKLIHRPLTDVSSILKNRAPKPFIILVRILAKSFFLFFGILMSPFIETLVKLGYLIPHSAYENLDGTTIV